MAEYIKIYYKKFWEHAKVPDRATLFQLDQTYTVLLSIVFLERAKQP